MKLIYILSPDTSLQHNKPGDKTGIDYAALFNELKRLAICSNDKRKRAVDEFFAQHLFHIPLAAAPAAEGALGRVPDNRFECPVEDVAVDVDTQAWVLGKRCVGQNCWRHFYTIISIWQVRRT